MKVNTVSTSDSLKNAPASAKLVAAVVFLQALAMLVFAIAIVMQFGSTELPVPAQIFEVFLIGLAILWLFMTARGVLRGDAWVRGSLIVIQLFVVILAFYTLGANRIAGVLQLLSGAVVLIGLFTTSLNDYLGGRR